ncbi:MAG: ATP-binding protein [Nitrolancea sp.]
MSVNEFTDLTLTVSNEQDVVTARAEARAIAQRLGFGIVDQSRIATAVSELTRNVLRYADNGRGEVDIRVARNVSDRDGIEIVVTDSGPGIADVDLVLQAGYSSGRGLGLGLSGTRRLMDEMEIESEVGRGTTITIRKWLRRGTR